MSSSPPLLTRRSCRDWLPDGLVAVVHLAPLPGAPRFEGDASAVLARARRDVAVLADLGCGAVILENFGDAPFYAAQIPALAVASMARIAGSVRERHPGLRLGINCLRNDASSAIAIAAACEADFVRVNVHCGAAWSDQGLLQGNAAVTLRERATARPQLKIFADLRVKHAAPVAARPLLEEALELRERGLADALLLTGPATGTPAQADEFDGLRSALGDVPLCVASGVDEDNAADWAARADLAIVGSALMEAGRAGGPIDAERAGRVRKIWIDSRMSRTEIAAGLAEKEHEVR